MPANNTLNLIRAHDPARRLASINDEQREQLRRAILATPLKETELALAVNSAQRFLHRRAVLAVALVLLVAVGGAIAASRLFVTPAQESQGLLDGSALFVGTHPTCARVSDQQFHCTLESAPTVEYLVGSYLGAKMLSVDATKHIDGGCIATSEGGLTWDCYLGDAAVKQGILDQALLGQYRPGPSHG